MLKKILSILLVGVMTLSLTACGGETGTSTTSSKRQVKSSLKGDLIFYTKNDEEGLFFTNNDDIPETLLTKLMNVRNVCVDEKRKNIIFENNDEIYIKSLKNINESPIAIGGRIIDGNIENNIWNNKLLICKSNNALFIYDLDTNKKERLSEQCKGCSCICENNLTFIEGTDVLYKKIVTYDLKNKSKKEKDISDFNILYFEFAGNLVYVNTYEDDNNISKLYKMSAYEEPILIDKIDTKKVPNETNKYLYLHHEIINTFYSGEMYFKKPTEFVMGKDGRRKKENYLFYYYDGKKIYEFENGAHIFKIDGAPYTNNTKVVAEYKDNINQSSRDNFIVKDKIYRNKILRGISDDGKQIIYEDKEKNNISVLLNTSTSETIELDKHVYPYYSPIKFNDENLLFVADNKDLILNDKLIDYNVNRTVYWWGDREGVRCNEDCSVIVYISNEDTLNIYRNGDIKTIGSSIKYMQLSNNNNAYFWRDNNIYLYKNEDVHLIAENASIKEYSLLR